MIREGYGFAIRHRSGRYFRSYRGHPGILGGTPLARLPSIELNYGLVDQILEADMVRFSDHGARFLSQPGWAMVADQFEVVARPGCGCCGSDFARRCSSPVLWTDDQVYRCEKHKGRDVCLVDGCRRTRQGVGAGQDHAWLCATHWRVACPPRSALRRTYLRFFRLAKRYGWTPALERRFDRFWAALAARARRPAEGHIDVAEIERMFGWAA